MTYICGVSSIDMSTDISIKREDKEMTNLTKKFLKDFKACSSGIKFAEQNKLFGFPLDRLDEVVGDVNSFVNWVRDKVKSQVEYDTNGNMIYYRNSYVY